MSISQVFYALVNDKNTIFQRTEFHSDHVIFASAHKLEVNTPKRGPVYLDFMDSEIFQVA